MAINPDQFVKFVRGTPTAYENLTTKSSNTLYFISETGATTGKLYLGTLLIGDGIGGNTLGDIVLEELKGRDLLVYDAAQEAWVNKPVSEAILPFTGATETADGAAGLVPVPHAGDEDKFLRGDGAWVTIPTTELEVDFDDNLFTTLSDDDNVLTLAGFENAEVGMIPSKAEDGSLEWVEPTDLSDYYTKTEVDTLISNIDNVGLSRKIVDDLEDIDLTASDAEKFIYLVPNDLDGTTNDSYTEYLVLDDGKTKSLERVGSWGVDLSDYVPVSVYEAEVGNLDDLIIRELPDHNDATIVDSINMLVEQLTWSTIPE